MKSVDAVTRIALLNELQKRKTLQEEKKFKFSEFAFKAQYDFFRGEGSRYRTAVCSRRSGKTVGIAGDIIDTCLTEKDVTCLYITLTKDNVRKILWGDIEKIINDYKIKCQVNHQLMSIKFPNGSRLLTGGAKDPSEIEKFRGLKLRKVYIDEAQSMRPHIKELIDDVLSYCLLDLGGSLYLTGTPGPIKAGAFYEYSHDTEWHNVKWTAFDNPHMHNPAAGKDLEVMLTDLRRKRGIEATAPSYRRETYGEWIDDLDSLVFHYDSKINHFVTMPEKLSYIFGIDIGYNDSDAIAVLGYSQLTNSVYLVEEVEKSKEDVTALAEEISKLQKIYKPFKMVIDAGALGKKIHEEYRNRFHLNIEAADKDRKFEFIEFLNGDLKRGVFRARSDSLFAQDAKLVTWDRTDPLKPKIASNYHSDILDAALYAYRACYHYIKEDAPLRTQVNTTAYMDELERKEAEAMENAKWNIDTEIDGLFDESEVWITDDWD